MIVWYYYIVAQLFYHIAVYLCNDNDDTDTVVKSYRVGIRLYSYTYVSKSVRKWLCSFGCDRVLKLIFIRIFAKEFNCLFYFLLLRFYKTQCQFSLTILVIHMQYKLPWDFEGLIFLLFILRTAIFFLRSSANFLNLFCLTRVSASLSAKVVSLSDSNVNTYSSFSKCTNLSNAPVYFSVING